MPTDNADGIPGVPKAHQYSSQDCTGNEQLLIPEFGMWAEACLASVFWQHMQLLATSLPCSRFGEASHACYCLARLREALKLETGTWALSTSSAAIRRYNIACLDPAWGCLPTGARVAHRQQDT